MPRLFIVWASVVALLLVASGCAADVDPELTLLPIETTVPPQGTGVVVSTSTSTTTEAPTPPTTQPPRGENPRRVRTAEGLVIGQLASVTPDDPLANADGVDPEVVDVITFQAVPYAAEINPGNRFDRPAATPARGEPFRANEPGVSCWQQRAHPTVEFVAVPDPGTDCRTLDIYTPAEGTRLPVVVWLHDGDNSSGSGHSPLYDGAPLAAQGAVVVTINQRLDAPAYALFRTLFESTPSLMTPNRGILDQQAALGWIAANIEAFGGNPSNVTLAGHSAGAEAVCAHIASPQSSTLFHKVILQSGSGCTGLWTVDQAFEASAAWLAETRCADSGTNLSACLNFLGNAEIIEASEAAGIEWRPVIDGVVVARDPVQMAALDQLGSRPLLVGSTGNEGSLFARELSDEVTEQPLIDTIASYVPEGAQSEVLAAQYTEDDDTSSLDALSTFLTDALFACPVESFAVNASDETSVYTYQFEYLPAGGNPVLGAFHGSELAFLFGQYETPAPADDGEADETDLAEADDFIASFLQRAWVRFARSGSPAGETVDWPVFLPVARAHQQITTEPEVVSEVRGGRCSLFE